MAKINFGTKEARIFKKGDLVLLREMKHHLEEYNRRPVIVTKDTRSNSVLFEGFCLIDCANVSSFQVEAFELATSPITLSN